MIILDTNVVSEIFKPKPDPAAAGWLMAQPKERCFLTAISKSELLFGLACMPDGRRKRDLADVMQAFFEVELLTLVLAFEGSDAEHYADILASRKRLGRRIGELDAQIAAIARRRSYNVATRNVSDFEHCGVEIINPWEYSA